MSRYAQETTVPVAKSKAEIEATISRYGASSFASMQSAGKAAIIFEAEGRRVMFELHLPKLEEFEHRERRGRTVKATPSATLLVASWAASTTAPHGR